MKINKIMTFLLLVLPAFMLQSCLKDDDEVFDKNSANRMAEYLVKAKEVLTSGNATWLMEMYPEADQSYGGYAFTIKFEGENAIVRSDLFKSSYETSSLWTLTDDDGPVLTFDTYNEILHYFSTPGPGSSGSAVFPNTPGYVAFEGEFGWIIQDVQQDVIKLRGKKTGNTVYMYRMTEDPKEYIEKAQGISEQMIFTGLKYVNGDDVIEGIIDVDYRQITFTHGEEEQTIAFAVTPTGIRLYKDLEMGGVTVRELALVMNGSTPVSMDSPDGVSFAATFPKGWSSYDTFNGDFLFRVLPSSKGEAVDVPVTLTPAGDGINYWLTGLSDNFDIKMKYDKPTGTLQMTGQILADKNDHSAVATATVNEKDYSMGMISFALPAGASSGSVSYSTTIGIKLEATDEPGTFKVSDNGKWSGQSVTCMRVYCFSSATTMSSSTRQSSVTVPNDYRFNIGGTYTTTLYYPKALIKQ